MQWYLNISIYRKALLGCTVSDNNTNFGGCKRMCPVSDWIADFREQVPIGSARHRLLIPPLRLIRAATCCHFPYSTRASPPGRTLDAFVRSYCPVHGFSILIFIIFQCYSWSSLLQPPLPSAVISVLFPSPHPAPNE